MPALQSAAAIESDSRFYVWGGFDLMEYRCKDDLIILEEGRRRGATGAPVFDIKYVPTTANMVASRRGNTVPVQKGTVPHARTGHTLTRLGETKEALLFGGVMEQEERKSFSVEWELACRDGTFYILDLDTFIWRRVPVPSATLARTYHTAECLETVRSFVIAFVGGVMHDKNTTTRIPINEVLLLTMNSQDTDTAVLSTVTLASDGPSTPVPYISYHATAQVNYNILVSGGFQLQHSSDIPKTSRHASSRVFILDIVGKKYKLLPKTQNNNQFGTAGHVLLTLAPDCIISVGGTSKQISMLSDRKYKPEKCDLLPSCTIAEAEETVEIQWVQCETPRCGKWVHVYCLKLNSIPEIYFCPHCKNKNDISVCVCSIHLKTCRIHLKKCTIPN